MTVTTTYLKDSMGRWLINPNPGTSAATDYLGRHVIAGNKDHAGLSLTFPKPSAWVTATAYTAGNFVWLSNGVVLKCTVSGTSGGSAPAAPGLGSTVTDGGATWLQISEPFAPAAWTATHAYTAGNYVALTAASGEALGALLVCTHAGTSASSAPAAPGLGKTVVDGTVTWTQIPNP